MALRLAAARYVCSYLGIFVLYIFFSVELYVLELKYRISKLYHFHKGGFYKNYKTYRQIIINV